MKCKGFRVFPGFLISFEHNSASKNIFLSACFCRDARLFLLQVEQKTIFGGTSGYRDSYLEYMSCHSKVFRLHAILHDAAGAVRSHSGKGAGYCYLIGGGPNSCLLAQVTGQLFGCFVGQLLPSILNSVHFWNSMSCIVLDIENADKNVIKKLAVFFHGSVKGYSFCPKMHQPPKEVF